LTIRRPVPQFPDAVTGDRGRVSIFGHAALFVWLMSDTATKALNPDNRPGSRTVGSESGWMT
jgi:hypothetical protein